jgi:hypothetical protein
MADAVRERIFWLKRFLHDRLHPGSTVGNNRYDWGYNYEEVNRYPHLGPKKKHNIH